MVTTDMRLDEALDFAAWCHEGQVRKGTCVPYIAHPMAVVLLLQHYGASEDTLIAGVLHDVLEDQPDRVNVEELSRRFGATVADLVAQVTKTPTGHWYERAADYLRRMDTMDPRALEIVAADKTHNLRSTLRELEQAADTDEVWGKFQTGFDGQYWWYAEVAGALERRIPEHPLVQALSSMVLTLRSYRATPGSGV